MPPAQASLPTAGTDGRRAPLLRDIDAAGRPAVYRLMMLRMETDPAADLPLPELAVRLADAMIAHVAFDGWSAAARAAAARDAGIDPDVAAMALPDAPAMLAAWAQAMDARMLAAMGDVSGLKVRDRIRRALVCRLETGDVEATRRALAILAQPRHAALSARLAWGAADAMWRAAGDTATDYNHYTKRSLLAAIYSATLLFWTQDDSDGHAATHGFIDRRIDGVMRFEKAKARVLDIAARLPDPARFLGRLRYPAV
jgi:ubiquinone biosynthesis protein COQ9